jgi:hypothetical protein
VLSFVLLKVTSSEAGFTVVYRAPQREIKPDYSPITLCKAIDDNQFIFVQQSSAYLFNLTDIEKLEAVHSVPLSLPSHLFKGTNLLPFLSLSLSH